MEDRVLTKLGEEVRKQGYGNDTMLDLVFNPVTGEFEQVKRGEITPSSGMVVTEMTREGFAHE